MKHTNISTLQIEKLWALNIPKTLPKAQQTQSMEYFYSFNNFISKQKNKQALKYWSNFSLVLFVKGREKHRKT